MRNDAKGQCMTQEIRKNQHRAQTHKMLKRFSTSSKSNPLFCSVGRRFFAKVFPYDSSVDRDPLFALQLHFFQLLG
jgi:hypothetical protein